MSRRGSLIEAKILINVNEHLMNFYSRGFYSKNLTHLWGKPEIIISNFNSGTFRARMMCSRCGSEKFVDVVKSYSSARSWYVRDNGYIRHPKDYQSSQCYITYHKSRRVHNFEERKEMIRQVEEEQKIIEERKATWEEAKIRNYKIVENMRTHMSVRASWNSLSAENRIAKIRHDMAIYRLYRYLNVSPGEIARVVGHNIDVIGIIGDVFRRMCLSDNSCIFRNILSGV